MHELKYVELSLLVKVKLRVGEIKLNITSFRLNILQEHNATINILQLKSCYNII